MELAVYTTAATAGANAGALLDSREFMSRTAELDPDAADFPSQVADLVKDAAALPRYQVNPVAANFTQPPAAAAAAEPPPAPTVPAAPGAPPAPASGADFSGAPGGNRLWTQADYDYWVAHDRDGAIVTKAIKDGLLTGLGIGKPKQKGRR